MHNIYTNDYILHIKYGIHVYITLPGQPGDIWGVIYKPYVSHLN